MFGRRDFYTIGGRTRFASGRSCHRVLRISLRLPLFGRPSQRMRRRRLALRSWSGVPRPLLVEGLVVTCVRTSSRVRGAVRIQPARVGEREGVQPACGRCDPEVDRIGTTFESRRRGGNDELRPSVVRLVGQSQVRLPKAGPENIGDHRELERPWREHNRSEPQWVFGTPKTCNIDLNTAINDAIQTEPKTTKKP